MDTLRRKTVRKGGNQQTVVLRKRKNDRMHGGKWMYVVEDADTGDRFGDPIVEKPLAKQEFDRVVDDIRRGMKQRSDDNGMGFPPYF